ncbi:HET domain-containing protein [Microdochium nivale]|nr:HET domain-containing protein [Microdochium nivale]
MVMQYSALDSDKAEIRVLRIHRTLRRHKGFRGRISTTLKCSLQTISLNDKPKFVALSYVWGDDSVKKKISVEGVAELVTRNLYDALCWYRDWKPDVSIWADAICINQTDLDEKSHQIRLMSRVYSQATKVVCWLGPSSTRLDSFLSWGNRLTNHWNRSALANAVSKAMWRVGFVARFSSWGGLKSGRLRRLLIEAQAYNGENDFSGLPYFERLWTFQECVLAEDRAVLVLGGRVRDFKLQHSFSIKPPRRDKIAELAKLDPGRLRFTEYSVMQEARAPLAGSNRHFWDAFSAVPKLTPGGFKSLSWLLTQTTHRVCQDPRDKVFGLLGLLDRSFIAAESHLLAVDYSKSIEQVFLDVLQATHIHEQGSQPLRVLKEYMPYVGRIIASRTSTARCGHAIPWSTGSLSSWHPDITTPRATIHKYAKITSILKNHRSTTDKIPTVDWAEMQCQDRTHTGLRFRARVLGRITLLSQFPSTTDAIVTTMACLLQTAQKRAGAGDSRGWIERVPRDEYFVHHKHMMQRIIDPKDLDVRLAEAARIPAPRSLHAFSEADSLRYWQRLHRLQVAGGSRSASSRDNSSDFIDSFCEHEMSFSDLHGKALAIFDNGHFGICSASAQVGDVLVFSEYFGGCLLLRSAQAGRRRSSGTSGSQGAATPALRDDDQQDLQTLHYFVDWPYLDGLTDNSMKKGDRYPGSIRQIVEETFLMI